MNQFNNKVQSESNLGVGTKSTKDDNNSFIVPTRTGQLPSDSPEKNNLHSLPFLERRSKQVHHISELMQHLLLSMKQAR